MKGLYTNRFIAGILLLSQLFLSSLAFGQNEVYTLPRPDHIVILFEENAAYSQIIGNKHAPHINALAHMPNAAIFTQFYGVMHPSQPNYITFFSGSNQGVEDDNLPQDIPFTTPNLCAELMAKGKTFKTYSEDLPSIGYRETTYETNKAHYARKHNPCMNWIGTGPNQFADTVSLPFSSFPGEDDYATLPTVSFVVPDLDHDMHNHYCGAPPCAKTIERADDWMYNNLDRPQQWALKHNTLFILIFDEDDDYHNNNIPMVMFGPMVKGGEYDMKLNHINLLHTIEDMYGLGHAGASATSKSFYTCWYMTGGDK